MSDIDYSFHYGNKKYRLQFINKETVYIHPTIFDEYFIMALPHHVRHIIDNKISWELYDYTLFSSVCIDYFNRIIKLKAFL